MDAPIRGGAEAWRVAGSLADARVPLIHDPLDNLPRCFETLHATLENPARLQAAGVRFAFAIGSTHNARNLTQAAGNAAAHGLPLEAALDTLTQAREEIFRIPGHHGSLKPGRVADLMLWDDDRMEVTSYPDLVVIADREIPRESRQTRLRDRYLQGRVWPKAYPDRER